MSGIGSQQTKEILQELEILGLDNDIYKTYLHHAGHTISAMKSYDVVEYRSGSPNVSLHQKLGWILRICNERNLRPGSREEITKSAIETMRSDWRPD